MTMTPDRFQEDQRTIGKHLSGGAVAVGKAAYWKASATEDQGLVAIRLGTQQRPGGGK